jgi:hypothetical protein
MRHVCWWYRNLVLWSEVDVSLGKGGETQKLKKIKNKKNQCEISRLHKLGAIA